MLVSAYFKEENMLKKIYFETTKMIGISIYIRKVKARNLYTTIQIMRVTENLINEV